MTPNPPLGYRLMAADADVVTAQMTGGGTELEQIVIQIDESVRQTSSEIGFSLRAILRGLNASLGNLVNVQVYGIQVHTAVRHIAVRIAREVYLNGEITAEQYAQIAEYIINSVELPPVGAYGGEAERNLQIGVEAVTGRIAQAVAQNQTRERTPGPIHRFGWSPSSADPLARGVKPARADDDFGLTENAPGTSIVGPESPPLPLGASAFGNPYATSLTGWYWTLPAGRVLPPEIGIVADGIDAVPGSPRGPTHYTIYPKVPMTLDQFNGLMRTLGWIPGAKK